MKHYFDQISLPFFDSFFSSLFSSLFLRFLPEQTGRISNVQSAMQGITNFLQNKLGFTVCEITKT